MRKKSTARPTPKARKAPTRKDSNGRVMPAHRKAAIEIWKSKKDKKFYFRLRSSNGKVMISNNQGYERRVSMLETLRSMVEIFKVGRFVIEEAQ